MKKLLLGLCIMFCSAVFATTYNLDWYVDGDTYTHTTCNTGGDIILPTSPTKRGHTFMGWSLKYREIEYLESSGTQWIDTGFLPNQDTRVEMVFLPPSGTRGAWFGSRRAMNDDGFADVITTAIAYRSDYADGQIVALNTTEVNTSLYNVKLKLDKNKNTTKLYNYMSGNMLVNVSHTYTTFNVPVALSLFGLRTYSTNVVGVGNSYRIYYTKIWDNGTLVRDFIPVLDGNGTPCMYDKVEGKFYYNAGTGDFIAGPIIGGE